MTLNSYQYQKLLFSVLKAFAYGAKSPRFGKPLVITDALHSKIISTPSKIISTLSGRRKEAVEFFSF